MATSLEDTTTYHSPLGGHPLPSPEVDAGGDRFGRVWCLYCGTELDGTTHECTARTE